MRDGGFGFKIELGRYGGVGRWWLLTSSCVRVSICFLFSLLEMGSGLALCESTPWRLFASILLLLRSRVKGTKDIRIEQGRLYGLGIPRLNVLSS